MRQPRDWYTTVQDNTLRKMKRLNFTPAEIAEKLDRSEWSVRERARTIGIPWRVEAGLSGLANSPATGLDAERDFDARQREADKRLLIELAKAFQRGDHLPVGTVIPLKLIG